MELTKAFVALGGNIGDALSTIRQATREIQALPCVSDFCCSQFYLTTPVSPIPQNDYINAVCQLKTSSQLRPFWHQLQEIEIRLGKTIKDKTAPRVIDLDLLFFGQQVCEDPDLQVPHRDWKNRLFVLLPLSDLVETIEIPAETAEKVVSFDLKSYMKNFSNPYNETVYLINISQMQKND